MSAPPYMKLYVADYLGDTHHLGALEHGAYLLLLMAMWRAGGSLPAADANLAKLARCTPDQWAEIRDVIMPLFRRRGGRISHKRVALELAKYEDTSVKRSEAGKRGGRRKPSENNEANEANATSAESKSLHNQNQNHIGSEGDKSPSGDGFAAPTDLDREAWSAAVLVLTQQGGMAEPKARAFFGKLLSQHGLIARELYPSLTAAMVNQTQDPQAYLTRAATQVATRRRRQDEPQRVGFV